MTDYTGQTFDRYYILGSLGEGGMASVYKAYDTRLERDVALKIIRTDMFMPSALQQVMKRFEREAKSLAKLSHPNIVSIIDYGEHEGVPYLVMEYLPGGTLKDRMLGRPLPWQDLFRLLLPVARALQFSHQQGIIHRDVKPSNILITLSGEPMLSDFGIAKLLESEGSTALTGTGVGIGTPEYMAPEQWVGKTSPQSDLYSLGVVLYEMVTGRKPYTADTPAAILLKQANEPLPRPRQSVPDLPERVEKVILKTLAKKPEERYQSLEEFSSALETSFRGQVKARQPIQPSEKAEVEKQPEPEQAVVILTKQIEDQPTLNARLPEYVEPADAVSQIKDANKTEIAVPELPPFKMDQPNPIVEEIAKRENLAWFRASLETIKFRPVWILALVGLVVVVIVFVVWRMHPPLTQPVLTSVSARYTYFTSNQSGKAEVYYLDPQGKIAQFTHTPGNFESWSPAPADGGYVYFTSNQSGKAEVYYLDPQGKIVQFTHTPGQFESWSPAPAAGGYVYFTSNQSGKAELYYLDPEGRMAQFTHTPGQFESWSPVPAAGGYVYFTSNQSGKAEVHYLDPQGKIAQFTHTPGQFESWSPALAAGGYVYFASNQSGKTEIYYLDPQGKMAQFTHTPGQFESWSPAPAAGGYVYFTSNQSGKTEIYYLDLEAISHRVSQTPGLSESWLKMFGITSAITQP